MSGCCGKNNNIKEIDPCNPPNAGLSGLTGTDGSSVCELLVWFHEMVDHCYEYACAEKKKGRKLVGIMCEYTPRELIMAAGAIPVCLCGGSVEMIPAAEHDLPANLCPLIKSTYGYSVEKANPFMEMADLLVAETTCDGKKKMYELLAKRHPMHVLELPQKPNNPEAFEYWLYELRMLKKQLSERFRVKITDEAIRSAIVEMNTERRLRRDLAELMKCDSPPLTGRELLDMKSLISCLPVDLEQYEKALNTLPGRKILPKPDQRVRVLLTGVPLPHGAERVMDVIEGNGGLVVCQENCTGIKPVLEDVDPDAEDPLRALAKKYFHLPCSVMTENKGRLDSIRKLAGEYRAGCVIELIWQACITYDVESFHVRRLVEDEIHLPYLRIETDYSPSDSARIATRVQALFETVKHRIKR
ncbi:MAG: double-cubane-cluster-containing anaerobic reductase [Kiritimatiellae bacterium]|nr:double-cubane-cluster-containing anaerobic reductase [Kiritimatiellia bacterium]